MLRVNNLGASALKVDEVLRIDPAIAAKHTRSELKGGEVLITLVGSVGNVVLAPQSVAGWNVARAVGVLPIPDPLVARWVAWSLRAPEAQAYIQARLNTTVQSTLNLCDLAAMAVSLPPPPEMARICSVLGALDAKVEANARLSSRLAQLVPMLFNREIRMHGVSWADGDLTTIARFVNGKNFTKDAEGRGRPVLRIKDLTSGLGPSTVYSERTADEDYVAGHWDLLFPWSGTLGVHRWDGPEGLINQHIFKVLPHDGFPSWFVEVWLRRHIAEFCAIARDKATTMGHIKREHLTEARVHIPSPREMNRLHAIFGPLDELLESIARETRRLARIRDELLPKLVSGHLMVSMDYADVSYDAPLAA